MSTTMQRAAAIEEVEVHAYEVPTETDQESDGTLQWESTAVVVVLVRSGGHQGLGYTYCHPAAAGVIDTKLRSLLEQSDPLMPQQTWAAMQVQARQLGHAGVAAMAISAVDVALWDLKSRLLGVCLADLLPRYRHATEIYGSGGFCNYSDEQLRAQTAQWRDCGCRRMKIKVGRDKPSDLRRLDVFREAAGAGTELMVDGNGAYSLEDGLLWAERFAAAGVRYFEEPLSSQDLAGLSELRRRSPPGLAIAAGEYGWNLPYFQQMLDARAVHVLQADVTRCGGITNLVRIDGLCRPATSRSPPTVRRRSRHTPVAGWRPPCTSSTSSTTTGSSASCSTARSGLTTGGSLPTGRGRAWASSSVRTPAVTR